MLETRQELNKKLSLCDSLFTSKKASKTQSPEKYWCMPALQKQSEMQRDILAHVPTPGL